MVKYGAKNNYLRNGQNILFWNFIVAAVLLTIIVLNFTQINKIIENNFKLIVSQRLLKEKQEQNQNLQMSALRAHSLKGLGEKAEEMKLVSIDKTEYLKISPEIFALANKP